MQAALEQLSKALPELDSEDALTTAAAAASTATTAAGSLLQQLVVFLTTTDPATLGEDAVALVVISYLVPPLGRALVKSLRGYAGAELHCCCRRLFCCCGRYSIHVSRGCMKAFLDGLCVWQVSALMISCLDSKQNACSCSVVHTGAKFHDPTYLAIRQRGSSGTCFPSKQNYTSCLPSQCRRGAAHDCS